MERSHGARCMRTVEGIEVTTAKGWRVRLGGLPQPNDMAWGGARNSRACPACRSGGHSPRSRRLRLPLPVSVPEPLHPLVRTWVRLGGAHPNGLVFTGSLF